MQQDVFPCRMALLAASISIALPMIAAAQAVPAPSAEAAAAPAPAASASAPKAAASAPEYVDAGQIQTVTVHARGRDETQQTVPMSVKAFSAKMIEDIGIRKPSDFVAVTPNLSLAESQSVGTSFMTIRGLSQVRNGEAPMAVVVDGVIQSDAKQFSQELFDVQSIEVLRGPQGALYGRNASGGAILITTKQPTNETTGFAQLTTATGAEVGAQGAVSGAIVPDKLFFRVAGNITNRDGYFENLNLHRKADPYRDETLRALLKWNVSENMTVDLRLNGSHDNAATNNFQYQPTHLNADCTVDTNNLFDFSRLNANHASRYFCANYIGPDTRDIREATLKADYDFDFATLSATYSHNLVKEYTASDQPPYSASRDVFPGFDGTQSQFSNVSTNSVEMRLTSPSKRGVRWMAGIYGLKTQRFISTGTGSDLGLGLDHITYDPAPDSATNPTTSWFADHDHNQATAAFGNVDYDVTSNVEASLALRYDRDHREQIVDPRQYSGTPTQPIGLPAGCTAGDTEACTKTATYSALQPKFSLRYKADDGSLVYASYGKGFRSGQFNQSGVGTAAAEATPPVLGVTDRIGAEITKSFELGYKSTFLNNRLQVNAALFRTEVTNAPYFVFIPAAGAQVLVPIDKVDITGGEIETVASLAPGWDAYAGFGVTDSKIKDYAVNPAEAGHRAPYVPNTSGNIGSQYRFGIGGGLRMLVRGDVIMKGKQYWDPENDYARSALTLVNLRTALEDASGKWSLALSVNNAFNKIYNAEWVSGGFAAPANPRVVRLDARYNF